MLLSPIHPSLDRVYVDPGLLWERGARTDDLFPDAKAARRRVVITGDAGTGKTTLIKRWLLRLLRAPERRPAPVLLRLRQFVGRFGPRQNSDDRGPLFAGLVTQIQARRNSVTRDAAVEAASALLDTPGVVAALDGLDECGPAFEQAVAEINRFADDFPRASILVTCRTAADSSKLAARFPIQIQIEDFSPAQITRFLDQWPPAGGRRASDLKGQLDGSPTVREFCRNPLALTMVVCLYLRGDQRSKFNVPTTRHQLYERALEELLHMRGQTKERPTQFHWNDKLTIVQAAALGQFASGQPNPGVIDRPALARAIALVERTLTGIDRKKVGDLARDGELTAAGEALLDELCNRDGLLSPEPAAVFGGQPGGYHFAHRTILEYLAARAIARAEPRPFGPRELVERFHKDYPAILPLYASQCGDPQNVADLCAALREIGEPLRVAEILLSLERPAADATDYIGYACTELAPDPGSKLDDDGAKNLRILAALAGRGYPPAVEALMGWLLRFSEAQAKGALEQAVRAAPGVTVEPLWSARGKLPEDYRVALVRGLSEQIDDKKEGDLALERLLALLADNGDNVRGAAAIAVTDLLLADPARLYQLRDSESFRGVDPGRAAVVWPAGEFFPANVICKIVEAAPVVPGALKVEALAEARRVLDQPGSGAESWRHVVRDWRRMRAWARVAGVIITVAFAVVVAGDLALLGVMWNGVLYGRAHHFTFRDGFREVSPAAVPAARSLGEQASVLIALVRKRYPRIVRVSRVAGEFRGDAYETVPDWGAAAFRRLEQVERWETRDYPLDEDRPILLKLGCGDPDVEAFRGALAALPPDWPGAGGVWLPSIVFLRADLTAFLAAFAMTALFVGGGVVAVVVLLGAASGESPSDEPLSGVVALHFIAGIGGACSGAWFFTLFLLPPACGLLLLGSILLLPRPNNPHVAAFNAFVRNVVSKLPRSGARARAGEWSA